MNVAYFHGEGILLSSLIYGILFLAGSGLLIFGFLKDKSRHGKYFVVGYAALVSITLIIKQLSGNLLFESFTALLTLPWSLILPCYGLDSSCTYSISETLVHAELNAAIILLSFALTSHRNVN